MKIIPMPGQVGVGDLRLSPLDVGFDLREHDIQVEVPDDIESAGYDQGGKTMLVVGSRDEIIEVLKGEGYIIA